MNRRSIGLALVVAVVLVAALTAVLAVASVPVRAQAANLVRYAAPVDDPVADPFRPPAHAYGPGNRGIEYANPSGTTVRAGADGEVVFAGGIGGVVAVSIEHYDGIRTTYTGLSDVWVLVGEQVGRGSTVGVADTNLHFGAKRRDHYLDPQILIDASTPTDSALLIPP